MSHYYKALNADRSCMYGTGAWPAVGEWLSVEGALVACANGLHVCSRDTLVEWIGPAIWEIECDPAPVLLEGKWITSRARLVRRCEEWTERTARLYAAHCALDVLHLFERQHVEDPRPRAAIVAAIEHAEGQLDEESMADARDAAWAAGDAARAAGDAARAAARAAGDAGDAGDAAWAAARDAGDAAWDAARDAGDAGDAGDAARDAGDAARAWQTARLMQVLGVEGKP